MKKLFVLTMALALVALFTLPAMAQIVANDVNGNGIAQGNTSGNGNTNTNQFNGANLGDNSTGFVNKSSLSSGDILSGNVTNADASSATLLNKSPVTTGNILSDNVAVTDLSSGAINKSSVTVGNSFNNNRLGGIDVNAVIGLDDSLNNNEVYVGDMTNTWQNAHQFEHQFDHQIDPSTAFQNTVDATVYLPISNVHLQQMNTDITAGDAAGSSSNGISQAQFSSANVAGLVAVNTNMGGVGTNQAALNVVTAFSAGGPVAP